LVIGAASPDFQIYQNGPTIQNRVEFFPIMMFLSMVAISGF
jgi:hypothetical protein